MPFTFDKAGLVRQSVQNPGVRCGAATYGLRSVTASR